MISPFSRSHTYNIPSSDPPTTRESPANDERIKFFEVFWCPLNLRMGRN
jgi:hypothetical protein